jgi:mannitol-specific phosphotransferase system IIBC component
MIFLLQRFKLRHFNLQCSIDILIFGTFLLTDVIMSRQKKNLEKETKSKKTKQKKFKQKELNKRHQSGTKNSRIRLWTNETTQPAYVQ